MTLTLHDALKTSYKDKDNQKLDMSKYGYTRDEDLSNHNHQVYHHSGENKLLFSVTGSHNKHDVGTDAYLGSCNSYWTFAWRKCWTKYK